VLTEEVHHVINVLDFFNLDPLSPPDSHVGQNVANLEHSCGEGHEKMHEFGASYNEFPRGFVHMVLFVEVHSQIFHLADIEPLWAQVLYHSLVEIPPVIS
jgi:hypothetical protein